MTKNELNAWVEERYDALMHEGKHGHYETLFKVVQEAIALVQNDPLEVATA
jgi:hypothetical protein